MSLYSIKMRSELKSKHISGAENIIEENELEEAVKLLLQRALKHDKGKSNLINLKIEKIEEHIEVIDPLKITTIKCKSIDEGKEILSKVLETLEIEKFSKKIINMLYEIKDMRGAILLDIKSMNRLEKDRRRGIRATYMDLENRNLDELDKRSSYGSAFIDALVLSSKVLNSPYIIGELCLSDDPNYTTGYISTKKLGYIRITNLKNEGIPYGGRIFLYDSSIDNVELCIDYLEKKKIIVKNDIQICREFSFKDFKNLDIKQEEF